LRAALGSKLTQLRWRTASMSLPDLHEFRNAERASAFG
jgi:hypothetical protein